MHSSNAAAAAGAGRGAPEAPTFLVRDIVERYVDPLPPAQGGSSSSFPVLDPPITGAVPPASASLLQQQQQQQQQQQRQQTQQRAPPPMRLVPGQPPLPLPRPGHRYGLPSSRDSSFQRQQRQQQQQRDGSINNGSRPGDSNKGDDSCEIQSQSGNGRVYGGFSAHVQPVMDIGGGGGGGGAAPSPLPPTSLFASRQKQLRSQTQQQESQHPHDPYRGALPISSSAASPPPSSFPSPLPFGQPFHTAQHHTCTTNADTISKSTTTTSGAVAASAVRAGGGGADALGGDGAVLVSPSQRAAGAEAHQWAPEDFAGLFTGHYGGAAAALPLAVQRAWCARLLPPGAVAAEAAATEARNSGAAGEKASGWLERTAAVGNNDAATGARQTAVVVAATAATGGQTTVGCASAAAPSASTTATATTTSSTTMMSTTTTTNVNTTAAAAAPIVSELPVGPVGEAFFSRLSRCLRSTARRHQEIGLQALLVHLHNEAQCGGGGGEATAATAAAAATVGNTAGFTQQTTQTTDSSAAAALPSSATSAGALLRRCVRGPDCAPFVYRLAEIMSAATGSPSMCAQAAAALLWLLGRGLQHSSSPYGSTGGAAPGVSVDQFGLFFPSSPSPSSSSSPAAAAATSAAAAVVSLLELIGSPSGDPTSASASAASNANTLDDNAAGRSSAGSDDPDLPFSELSERLRGDEYGEALEAMGLLPRVLSSRGLLLAFDAEAAALADDRGRAATAASTNVKKPTSSSDDRQPGETSAPGSTREKGATASGEHRLSFPSFSSSSLSSDTLPEPRTGARLFAALLQVATDACCCGSPKAPAAALRLCSDVAFTTYVEEQLTAVVTGALPLTSLAARTLLETLRAVCRHPAAARALLDGTGAEPWVLFFVFVCTLQPSDLFPRRQTRLGAAPSSPSIKSGESATGGTGVSARATAATAAATGVKESGDARATDCPDNNDSIEDDGCAATLAAVLSSLLLLRDLARCPAAVARVLLPCCDTLMRDGVRLGAAAALEVWFLQHHQRQQQRNGQGSCDGGAAGCSAFPSSSSSTAAAAAAASGLDSLFAEVARACVQICQETTLPASLMPPSCAPPHEKQVQGDLSIGLKRDNTIKEESTNSTAHTTTYGKDGSSTTNHISTTSPQSSANSADASLSAASLLLHAIRQSTAAHFLATYWEAAAGSVGTASSPPSSSRKAETAAVRGGQHASPNLWTRATRDLLGARSMAETQQRVQEFLLASALQPRVLAEAFERWGAATAATAVTAATGAVTCVMSRSAHAEEDNDNDNDNNNNNNDDDRSGRRHAGVYRRCMAEDARVLESVLLHVLPNHRFLSHFWRDDHHSHQYNQQAQQQQRQRNREEDRMNEQQEKFPNRCAVRGAGQVAVLPAARAARTYGYARLIAAAALLFPAAAAGEPVTGLSISLCRKFCLRAHRAAAMAGAAARITSSGTRLIDDSGASDSGASHPSSSTAAAADAARAASHPGPVACPADELNTIIVILQFLRRRRGYNNNKSYTSPDASHRTNAAVNDASQAEEEEDRKPTVTDSGTDGGNTSDAPYRQQRLLASLFALQAMALAKHGLDAAREIATDVVSLVLYEHGRNKGSDRSDSSSSTAVQRAALAAQLAEGVCLAPPPAPEGSVSGAARSWLLHPLLNPVVDGDDEEEEEEDEDEFDATRTQKDGGSNNRSRNEKDDGAGEGRRVPAGLWAVWLRRVLGLDSALLETLHVDHLLSHTLLWVLSHRAELFSTTAAPPTSPAEMTAAVAVSSASSSSALTSLLLALLQACRAAHPAALPPAAAHTLSVSLQARADTESGAPAPVALHACLAALVRYVAFSSSSSSSSSPSASAYSGPQLALSLLQVWLCIPLANSKESEANGDVSGSQKEANQCGTKRITGGDAVVTNSGSDGENDQLVAFVLEHVSYPIYPNISLHPTTTAAAAATSGVSPSSQAYRQPSRSIHTNISAYGKQQLPVWKLEHIVSLLQLTALPLGHYLSEDTVAGLGSVALESAASLDESTPWGFSLLKALHPSQAAKSSDTLPAPSPSADALLQSIVVHRILQSYVAERMQFRQQQQYQYHQHSEGNTHDRPPSVAAGGVADNGASLPQTPLVFSALEAEVLKETIEELGCMPAALAPYLPVSE